jgi:Cu(I)/Ag(I) efflux system membrane fusion protein
MNFRNRSIGKISLPIIMALLVGATSGILISNFTIVGEKLDFKNKDGKAQSDKPAEKEVLYWVAPMDPNYRRDEPGKSPMGMDLVPVYAEEKSSEPDILYWVAPMDPNYRRDKPGKSPMGMDLIPVYAQGSDVGNAVHISSAMQQSLGVRTTPAERRSLFRKIEATGYVALDETLVSQINLRTEGWIERLLVKNEGERIKKGQLLLEFYSPQLVNSQKEYVQAKRRDDIQMVSATAKKLLALGMVQTDIDRLDRTSTVSNTIQVLAPQDGIITSLNVREGVFVKPDTAIMALADLSSVWLHAEVFESQADWVAVSQSAEAQLNYIPGEIFGGRVDYVYPILDPKTRTLQVRLRFDNPQERLKPNMYSRVTIFGKAHPGALSIPREALIRGQDTDRVVVALGDGNFTVYEVVSGIESGEWVEIIAGLEDGEEVVTSAQFLIDSEASVAGSIRRLDASALKNSRQAATPAFVSGTVEGLDRQSRRIRISHGPIEQLGWAAMTMEFDVLPGSDLKDIQIGQLIQFKMTQSDVGDYVIQLIQSPETQGDDGVGEGQPSSASKAEMNHDDMDHSGMDHSGMDHSGMDHGEMNQEQMDHSTMDHGEMNQEQMDHSTMDHSKMNHDQSDPDPSADQEETSS